MQNAEFRIQNAELRMAKGSAHNLHPAFRIPHSAFRVPHSAFRIPPSASCILHSHHSPINRRAKIRAAISARRGRGTRIRLLNTSYPARSIRCRISW
jgi:hypothetical protein